MADLTGAVFTSLCLTGFENGADFIKLRKALPKAFFSLAPRPLYNRRTVIKVMFKSCSDM